MNFLNVFFQPILSKNNINTLSKENIFWNFPTNGWIYSWDFIISNVSSDLTIWVSKIILDKNEYYNNWNISKVILINRYLSACSHLGTNHINVIKLKKELDAQGIKNI